MEKLLFWDWSGTLADEAAFDRGVCLTMEQNIAQRRKISPERAAHIFQTYLQQLENTWQWHDYVRHGRCLDVDWKSCHTENLDLLKPVPGADEVLNAAHSRGYRNILATNAVREVILLRAGHLSLLSRFDLIIASNDVRALKAEGKHYILGLAKMPSDPKSSFSIGDNPKQDIRPAQKSGLRTIFCAYGKHKTHYHSDHLNDDHDAAEKPDFLINNLQEILNIL